MKNEVIESSKTKKIKSNGYLIKHGIKKWTDFDEDDHILFEGVEKKNIVWMSHQDYVESVGEDFKGIARTANTPFAAFANDKKKIYGLQFHPEVVNSNQGL